jgi:hypothetical protein
VEIPSSGSDDGLSWQIVDNVRGHIAPHTFVFDMPKGCALASQRSEPRVTSRLKRRFEAWNRQVQVWTSLGRKR